MNSASDIFLSYNREDQAVAKRFAEAFEAAGLSVWWDVTLRSGDAYDAVTEDALRNAKAVVVLWSPRSVRSRWVRAEASIADENDTLAPAKIEACDLPVMFRLTQTADLRHWRGEKSDPAWRTFLADVRRLVGGEPPQNAAQQPSLAPARSAYWKRTSLAVLPVVNRSRLPEDDDFADDMTEDLTVALSGSPWVHIIAASATAAYRKGARDLRQIGRDLGAHYLLESNVRRMGPSLRVTAQLVEAESCDILWAGKFERNLAELASRQEDLVKEVVGQLGAQVLRFEMDHALNRPGQDSAWEARMRSLSHARRATRSGWEATLAEARSVVDANPDDGTACAGLAAAQAQCLHHSGGSDPEMVKDILENIRRARKLAPDNPQALSAIASALSGLGRLREAVSPAQRAIDLDPNYPQARMALGAILLGLNRPDEALQQLDAAEQLAPNTWWVYYCALYRSVAHQRAGRLEQALAEAERAARLLVAPEGLTQNMLCLAIANRWSEALDTLQRLRDLEPETSLGQIENYVRYLYAGSQTSDYLEIAGKLWDEVECERP
jgi:TolB-like protein